MYLRWKTIGFIFFLRIELNVSLPFPSSRQLADELRRLQRTEGLGLEARLRPPGARPDDAQLLWRRHAHGSR